MNGAIYDPPDWLIMGFKTKEGLHFVMASKQLAEASIDVEYSEPAPYFDGLFTYGGTGRVRRVRFGARTRDFADEHYAVASGDDYPDALRNLMKFWDPTPDPADQAALRGAGKELSP